ncbi:MAG: hypothetical protein ACLFUN_09415 [Desulfobacterales bacterium]
MPKPTAIDVDIISNTAFLPPSFKASNNFFIDPIFPDNSAMAVSTPRPNEVSGLNLKKLSSNTTRINGSNPTSQWGSFSSCNIAAYDQLYCDTILDADKEDEFTIYMAPVSKP